MIILIIGAVAWALAVLIDGAIEQDKPKKHEPYFHKDYED